MIFNVRNGKVGKTAKIDTRHQKQFCTSAYKLYTPWTLNTMSKLITQSVDNIVCKDLYLPVKSLVSGSLKCLHYIWTFNGILANSSYWTTDTANDSTGERRYMHVCFLFFPLKVINNPAFDRTKRWVISANKAGKTTSHIITGEVWYISWGLWGKLWCLPHVNYQVAVLICKWVY